MSSTDKRTLNAYVPRSVYDMVAAEAKRKRRSVSGQVCYILEQYFAKKEVGTDTNKTRED